MSSARGSAKLSTAPSSRDCARAAAWRNKSVKRGAWCTTQPGDCSNVWVFALRERVLSMSEPQAVASRYADRRRLWKAAIKWPMYSVAVMPVLLAAGWQFGGAGSLRWLQLGGFVLAAILLLLWENLSNDVFDAATGVDATGKPHSVVNLTGRRDRVAQGSTAALVLGLLVMAGLAWNSSGAVLALVLVCCGLGYVYQGPPFRLSYRGLGEPLCWLAFGPFATAAALVKSLRRRKRATRPPCPSEGEHQAWACSTDCGHPASDGGICHLPLADGVPGSEAECDC